MSIHGLQHTLVDGQVDVSRVASSCHHILWYRETDSAKPYLTGLKLRQALHTEATKTWFDNERTHHWGENQLLYLSQSWFSDSRY